MKKAKILLPAVSAGAAATAAVAVGLWQGYLEAFGAQGSRLVDPFRSFGHKAGYYVRLRESTESMSGRHRRRYELTNARGQKLCAYYYPCGDSPSGKIAFIVHGYRANHAEAAGPICQSYLDRGFDVFGCDHVASGESEGSFVSFDYYESQDCLMWLDFLVDEFGPDVSIVLHGFSMGAATVMKMSDQVPANVKFIVEDSGFNTGEELLRSNMGKAYPVLNYMNRFISGFYIEQTDVRPHLLESRVPMLFVHGHDDPLVPFYMGAELYSLYPGEKDCLFCPGIRHVETSYYRLPLYEEKLDSFIEKYM